MAKPATTQRPARRRPRFRAFGACCLIAIATARAAGAQPPAAVVPEPLWRSPAPVALPEWSPDAEYRFGQAYDTGSGVPQNFAAAYYWFFRAAQRGYAPAQLELSRYYMLGIAVPKDLVQAYLWANLAAAQLPSGVLAREAAVQFRDYVRFKLNVPQLALAQQLATGWPPLPLPAR